MGRKIAAAFLLVLLLGPSYGQLTSTSPLVTHTAKISPVLKDAVAYLLANPVYDHALPTIVIVKQEFWDQAASGQPDDQLLPLIRSYTAQLTAQQIVALLGSDPVEYITLDTLLLPSASESENVSLATIGAGRVRVDGYDGSGIVAAIFDSGIGQHPDIDPDRKVVSVDATSGTVTVGAGNSDGYGHGTHAGDPK